MWYSLKIHIAVKQTAHLASLEFWRSLFLVLNCRFISSSLNILMTQNSSLFKPRLVSSHYMPVYKLNTWYFVDRASQYNLFFFISNLIHCFSVYVQYLLSSFRPHRPIIRRSKLSFLNGRTTKTSAEGENTIGYMYNLDLLMMGLWGLKHVEERG